MEEKEIKDLAQKICNLLFDEGYTTSIVIYWAAQRFLKEKDVADVLENPPK